METRGLDWMRPVLGFQQRVVSSKPGFQHQSLPSFQTQAAEMAGWRDARLEVGAGGLSGTR